MSSNLPALKDTYRKSSGRSVFWACLLSINIVQLITDTSSVTELVIRGAIIGVAIWRFRHNVIKEADAFYKIYNIAKYNVYKETQP